MSIYVIKLCIRRSLVDVKNKWSMDEEGGWDSMIMATENFPSSFMYMIPEKVHVAQNLDRQGLLGNHSVIEITPGVIMFYRRMPLILFWRKER